MKKVIAIAATLVIGASVMAMADQTNWAIQVKATNTSNMNFQSALTVGTWSGYTAGVDPSTTLANGAEPGTISPVSTGKTLATVSTKIAGAANPGIKDFRLPKPAATTDAADLTPTWDMHVYQMANGGVDIPVIKLTFTPVGLAYNWTANSKNYFYGYKFDVISGNFYTSSTFSEATRFTGSWFNNATKMGSSYVLYFDNSKLAQSYDDANAGILRLTLTPEPGSMLALGSGLAGLLGFAIRRKR